MKKILASILLICLLMACSQKEPEQQIVKADSTAKFSRPDVNEQQLRQLFSHQLQIMRHPDDPQYRNIFIKEAYQEKNKAVITFGTARKKHPETTAPISSALIKRAALLDAKRWAAYALQWINNIHEPGFGKIETQNNAPFMEIGTFNHGDSLVLAIASEVTEKGNK